MGVVVLDYVLFFERAGMEGAMVKVKLRNGETIEGIPSNLDESDDDYLGVDFYDKNGVNVGCFLKDIESAERIPAEA
jgi:hypothetical protein